jgi:hypothetical protein
LRRSLPIQGGKYYPRTLIALESQRLQCLKLLGFCSSFGSDKRLVVDLLLLPTTKDYHRLAMTLPFQRLP